MHGLADIEELARSLTVADIIERELEAGIAFGPYHRKWLTERAPDRVRRQLELAAKHPGVIASKQSFTAADYADFPSASPRAAINTTVTETNLWDPAVFGTLPVGSIRGGTMWIVQFGGVMGTTATPAISFRARVGTNNAAPPTGVDMGVGPTVTLGTFTAQPFYGEFLFGVRSIGVAASTTTMTGNGFVKMPAAAAATVTPFALIGGLVPTNIDQLSAQGIAVSVIWGTSNVANTITPQWVLVRSAN